MSIVQALIGAIASSGGGSGGGYPQPGSGTYISNVGAAFGGVQGTAYDPGGGIPNVFNAVGGWAYYIKDGEFNNNTGFFNGVSMTGADQQGGFGDQAKAKEYYAIQWVGYIYVQTTGDYNIHLSADDVLYFWIGTNALSGNFNLSNYHHSENNGESYAGNSVTLTGGLYYPIRMWFQEWSGNEKAQVHIGPVASAALAINQWSTSYNSQTGGHGGTYYTLTPAANDVDEGASLTFNVGGDGIINDTYYWTIETNAADFATTNGSFVITNNSGSFSVTPSADAATEGGETFTVSIRSGSTTGTILATSSSVTINDTSQTPPEPTYEWGIYDTSGNEGDTLTFNVDTTNVADGTTLYWNVVLISTISVADFISTSGDFSINSDTGSFNFNIRSDTLTEGGELFTVQIRTGSNSGTVVLTSGQITIGDTSAGNRAPIAYLFNGSGSYTVLDNNVYSNITNNPWNSTDTIYILQGSYPTPQVGWQWRYDSFDTWRNILSVTDNGGGYWALQVDLGGSGPAGTTSQLSDNINADWALGTTWTIEFWVKPTVVPGRNGAPNTPQRILSQNTDLNVQNNNGYNNIDVCFTQGIIAFANQYAGFDAPAEMVGVWSHVAISSAAGNVKGFINGVQVYNYGGLNVNFTNGVADLYVGKNGTRASPNVNSFDGRLTDIRISNTARYTSAFNPATALAPTTDGNTKLLLTPKQDSWYGSAGRKLGYNNVVTVDYPNPPIYTVDYVGPNNVDEGSGKAFAVSGTNIPNGTYYWTVTNSSDFATTNGEFEIASNSGSFSVTPSEDATTEGAETFTVQIRSGSITGVILATSSTVTINDTSLTKVQLTSGTSLAFNGTDNRRVVVEDNLTDWNLGDNWTIEWWHKIPAEASGFLAVLSQDSNVAPFTGIDIFINNGSIQMFNGAVQVGEAPATRGEWNHIAIQRNGTALAAYINGVSRTISGTGYPGTITPSSPLNLVIGSRTSDGGATFWGQYFNGQLANIRISTTARYSGTFTVPTTVTIDGSTVLALDGSTGSGGMLTDEAVYAGIGGVLLPRHTLTNVGAVIFPSITITNVSVGFNSRAATVDFTANVTQSETATIFFEWAGGGSYSGPHTLTVEPGSNIYTSPTLSLAGAGSDLTTEITIASGANACTSNIYTGSWSVICLVEGTMVTMADGSYKAIEDVRYNDLLRVWNFDLGEFSEALPVFVKQEETHAEHYRFTFSDGTVLRTVGHHVFNKQAGAFTMLVRDTTPVGTITFNELGEEVTLISKETIQEPVKFYNVWTQYHLNLFAQGILTSNRFNNIYPIQDMKFVKDNRALRPLEEFANIDPKYISGLRLQEQPAHYSAEYIRDYVENKLERLDIANTVNYVYPE